MQITRLANDCVRVMDTEMFVYTGMHRCQDGQLRFYTARQAWKKLWSFARGDAGWNGKEWK